MEGLSRRAALALGGTLVLAACVPAAGPAPVPSPAPDPDLLLRRAVADDVRKLVAAYAAVAARAFPDGAIASRRAMTLAALAAEHDANARALAGPRPATTPTPPAPLVPSTAAAARAWLISLEAAASSQRAEQSLAVGPDLARLLAAVGACNAAHAALLTAGAGAPLESTATPETTEGSESNQRQIEVLQRVLAAQHAVIYGYGVSGARLRGAARASAVAGWTAHRSARDAVRAFLTDRAATPEPPAPAYALPLPVGDPSQATALLTLLEERLAAGWADAVADAASSADRGLRLWAAQGLAAAAVAAARWRGSSVPFPGLPERAS